MGNNSTAAPEGNIPRMVRSHDIHLNSDYVAWIQDVKKRFRSARIKAAVKVNSEQLLFNWELGRDLVERKAEETWGRGIVEQVSLDLQNEFARFVTQVDKSKAVIQKSLEEAQCLQCGYE